MRLLLFPTQLLSSWGQRSCVEVPDLALFPKDPRTQSGEILYSTSDSSQNPPRMNLHFRIINKSNSRALTAKLNKFKFLRDLPKWLAKTSPKTWVTWWTKEAFNMKVLLFSIQWCTPTQLIISIDHLNLVTKVVSLPSLVVSLLWILKIHGKTPSELLKDGKSDCSFCSEGTLITNVDNCHK